LDSASRFTDANAGFALEHARVGNLLAIDNSIDNPLRGNVSGELESTINF
jgi:hypothetical protein